MKKIYICNKCRRVFTVIDKENDNIIMRDFQEVMRHKNTIYETISI